MSKNASSNLSFDTAVLSVLPFCAHPRRIRFCVCNCSACSCFILITRTVNLTHKKNLKKYIYILKSRKQIWSKNDQTITLKL